MRKTKWFFGVLIAFAISSCTGYKQLGTNTRIEIKDSIVYKTDTQIVEIEKRVTDVKLKIDTLRINDTITNYNKDSVLMIKYWKDEAGRLEIECLQKSFKKNVEVKKKESYKTISEVKEIIIEVEKKVVPFWVWLIIGLESFVIIGLIIKF